MTQFDTIDEIIKHHEDMIELLDPQEETMRGQIENQIEKLKALPKEDHAEVIATFNAMQGLVGMLKETGALERILMSTIEEGFTEGDSIIPEDVTVH